MQGRAVLLDRTRRTLAETPINLEKPAETADARGGVGALIRAADQLAVDLLAWERGQSRTAAAGGCFD